MANRRKFLKFYMWEKSEILRELTKGTLYDTQDYDELDEVSNDEIKDYIMLLLQHLDAGWSDCTTCPQCNFQECSCCSYGFQHGICHEGGSNYSNMGGKFRTADW